MTLTDGEMLILLMLCDIYISAGIKGEIDPIFIKKALLDGHLWSLRWKYPSIIGGNRAEDPSVVLEAFSILVMWSDMHRAYARLAKDEQERVMLEAKDTDDKFAFAGFGVDNEKEHLSVAIFMVEQLGLFSELKNSDMYSELGRLDGYRLMLAIYSPISKDLGSNLLSAEDLIVIFKTRDGKGTGEGVGWH